VLGAPDLSGATRNLGSSFGISFDTVGKHPVMATHNWLLRLNNIYPEAIATNLAASPQRTRWFSMDDPKTKLRLAQRIQPLC
jgi:hypothetical protein